MALSEIIARFFSDSFVATIKFLFKHNQHNSIPDSEHLSPALALVVNVILNLFGICALRGIQFGLILAALFVRNKKAQKHLRTRLRQKIDSLSIVIGRSCRIEPFMSIALVPVQESREEPEAVLRLDVNSDQNCQRGEAEL